MATLLSLEEVAVRLGVSYNTVRGYIESGRLRSTKIGRTVRVSEEELQKFLGAQEPEQPPAEERA